LYISYIYIYISYIYLLWVSLYTAQHAHVYINTYCVYWYIINIDRDGDNMPYTHTDWYMYKCNVDFTFLF